jgi:hypothetical protein
MSGVFLNYDDVRRLVKVLGHHRPAKPSAPSDIAAKYDGQQGFEIIASALGISGGVFLNRILQSTFSEVDGVPMSWQQYCDLCLVMLKRDLTTCRHTERLEIVANCLGWRADALMHDLKHKSSRRHH